MAHRTVALLIETSNAYARGLLDGIRSYVRAHQRWSIYLPEQGRGAEAPKWLSKWQGDGIIARIESDDVAVTLKKMKLPVVDVSAARRLQEIPWVETDDSEIAKLAAGHLLDRGFRNLAFCGDDGFNWSLWRREQFENVVRQAGCQYFEHLSHSRSQTEDSWNKEKLELTRWLKKLPRPIGIFASYDIKAQKLLEICRELSISVPEEMAVIGVDNDRLLCDLSFPPLTSVIPNTHRTGYEAAMLLDRMMSGETVPAEAHLIKPIGIETRQSTDVLAIDDPHVAMALRIIRQSASLGINVQDVLKKVPLSRRVLESRFQKLLGRTPHQELIRLRIAHVRQLLIETNLSLAEIATRTGFEHVEYLSVAFKREVGHSPREFRRMS
ncbi:MAG TPA: XylR family transcriptional regulator [Planctomicrobium sp.]|nr:XylR family transcriptional regulator [Planctomicrobium sp.]